MAIVPNKDGMGIIANGFVGVVDRNYCTPNRTGSGIPTGNSLYASEIMLDTATGLSYRAMSGPGAIQWASVDVS